VSADVRKDLRVLILTTSLSLNICIDEISPHVPTSAEIVRQSACTELTAIGAIDVSTIVALILRQILILTQEFR